MTTVVSKEVLSCKAGAIVEYTNPVHGKKNWRVVENWCARGEPLQLLVTPLEGEGEGKTYPVSARDCTLISAGTGIDRSISLKGRTQENIEQEDKEYQKLIRNSIEAKDPTP